jgi:hypothetical protein
VRGVKTVVARMRGKVGDRRNGEEPETVRPPWLLDAALDLTREEDAFGLIETVDRLAETVSLACPPFVLSLSGSWGIGKSTVAETLVQRLKAPANSGTKRTAATLIDLWTLDISRLRYTLAVEVAAALHEINFKAQPKQREDVAKELDAAIRTSEIESRQKTAFSLRNSLTALRQEPLAALLLIGLVAALSYATWLVVGIDTTSTSSSAAVGILVASIVSILVSILVSLAVFTITRSGFVLSAPTVSTTRGPAEQSVETARAFASYVSGPDHDGARVVVVIDNLDRLPGAEAVQALGEIRSLVDIRGSRCVFILPVDRERLEGHVANELTGELGDHAAARNARDFLDKFFNLDLRLTPPAPVDIRDWARKQARLILPPDDPDDLDLAVSIAVFAAGSSPRKVKRILNGVSARHGLIDPKERPPLAKLALVETIVERIPACLDWFSNEPRRFTKWRTGELNVGLPVEWAQQDQEWLRKLVDRYPQVAISQNELRVMLALRGDREWNGVSDPSRMRQAIQDGDRGEFDAAFDETPEPEREAALESAVNWVEKSSWSPPDALMSMRAVVGRIKQSSAQERRFRWIAVDYLIAMPDVRAGAPVELVAYAFGDDADARLSQLASAFASTFVSSPSAGADVGVMTGLKLGASRLDGGELTRVSNALRQCSFGDTQVLFEDPVAVSLLLGLAETYGEKLAAVDLAADNTAELIMYALKMAEYATAGGLAPNSLTTFATNLSRQLTSVPGELSTSSVTMLGLVPKVFATYEVEQPMTDLARALDGRPMSPQQPGLLDCALQLPQTDASMKITVARFDQWLTLGNIRPEEIEPFLQRRLATLNDQVSVWVDQVATQWFGQEDSGFAKLALTYGPASTPTRLMDSLVQQSSAVPARAGELVDLFGADEPTMEAQTVGRLATLIVKLGTWSLTVPVAEVLNLGPVLVKAEALRADASPVVDALRERARVATLADFVSVVRCLMNFEKVGLARAATAAGPLLSVAVALGVVDPTVCAWLSSRGSSVSRPDALLLLANTIADASVSVPDVVAMVREVHNTFRQSSGVAKALIERADSDKQLADGDVDALLAQSLDRWRLPPARGVSGVLSRIAGEREDLRSRVSQVKSKLNGPADRSEGTEGPEVNS